MGVAGVAIHGATLENTLFEDGNGAKPNSSWRNLFNSHCGW